MCLTRSNCFPRRICRKKDLSARFWHCQSRCVAWIRMRLRSDSAEPQGVRLNFLPDQSARPAAGRRFKLPKFLAGQRAPAAANNGNNTSTTDGRHSPNQEEPQRVALSYSQNLEACRYCEASQLLIQREERLFGAASEAEALRNHDEEENKLAEDYTNLKHLVEKTLKVSLTPGEINVEALTSAVKAVSQEEDQDQRWKQRDRTPTAWRPGNWKKLHDQTLRSLVDERMDNPLTAPVDQGQQSSIQADILSMGRQLKEDLLWVVEVVKVCYPPGLDICNCYAQLYHQHFSAKLKKITEFGLEDKDCTYLLRWVNEFYPGIFQKPELATEIDAEVLGKLLPKQLLKPLEKQYLSKQQDELRACIVRILNDEKERWTHGEEPTREDGYFCSPVAYDIIQCVNGMVTSAEMIVGDLQKAQGITRELPDLMQRFKAFQNEIIKQNKAVSSAFIKANLGCIEQISDFFERKSRLFPDDVQRDCVLILDEMKQSAHAYLLKPVHEALKPHYRKLGTSDWLKKPQFEKLLECVERELQDLQGSTESSYQGLLAQLHHDITTEYVRRLQRGELKLKDKEKQTKAFETVQENADSLHKLFVKEGSESDWLKDILTRIAELLKLQDVPAIQMHVVAMGSDYPDLSWKHVSALLKLKTNLSKADRKTIKESLSDLLQESSSATGHPFFSMIQVK